MSILQVVTKDSLRKELENKKLVVFGASTGALYAIFNLLQGENKKIAYFVDNDVNKWGGLFIDIPVHSPAKLYQEDKDNLLILVAMMLRSNEEQVLVQLSKMGFENICASHFFDPNNLDKRRMVMYTNFCSKQAIATAENNIERLLGLLCDEESKSVVKKIVTLRKNNAFFHHSVCSGTPQYFNEIFSVSKDGQEVYFDCGPLNTGTILSFMRLTNYNYKKIYAFEPDERSFEKLKQVFATYDSRITILPYAVNDKDGSICFASMNTGESHVVGSWYYPLDVEQFKKNVQTIALDTHYENENVTFIKMDIEGSEIAALNGARKIIMSQKPKLAISIYHNPNDLWEIPFLINSMVPEYKMYIRHHVVGGWHETVLYATL